MAAGPNDWVGLVLSNGRYRVDRKLGEGGMGFVYHVHDSNIDADVVIKVPRRSMLDDPEFAPRFAREIRALVKLAHPNIVRVSDVGEYEGLPFAVMQYLSGGSLEDRQPVDASGDPVPAPPASVLGWIAPVAAALDFVHAQGYVHRDVKPGNVLFDEHGHAFLSDFGVAKALSTAAESAGRKGTLTSAGMVLGTPEYMAPELFMGEKFGGAIDQYALAITAYELLCGRRPFAGATGAAILTKQAMEPPPPLRELNWEGSDAVSAVILKAISKSPEDRFATCVAFASELERAILAAKWEERRPSIVAPGRLECPSCSSSLKLSQKVLENLDKYRGSKGSCRSCGAVLLFAEGGLRVVGLPGDSPEAGEGGTRLFSTSSLPTSIEPSRPATPANRVQQASRTVAAVPPATPRPSRPRTVVEGKPFGGQTSDDGLPTFESAEPVGLTPELTRSRLPLYCGIALAATAALGIVAFAVLNRSGEKSAATPTTAAVSKSEKAKGGEIGSLVLTEPTSSGPLRKVESRRPESSAAGGESIGGMAGRDSKGEVNGGLDSPDPDSEGGAEKPATKAPEVPQPKADRPVPEPKPIPDPDEEAEPKEEPVLTVRADKVPLESIVKDPEAYVGQEITPSGFHFASNVMLDGPDGMKQLIITNEGANRVYPDKRDGPSAPKIVLVAGLAEEIEKQIEDHKLFRFSKAGRGYPVILTVRIVRRALGAESLYLIEIQKIKYLIDLDETAIANKTYDQSFKNYVVTPEGSSVEIGESDEWQVRYRKRIKNILNYVANQKRAKQNIVLDRFQASFIQAGLAGAAAQEKAQVDFLRRIRGN